MTGTRRCDSRPARSFSSHPTRGPGCPPTVVSGWRTWVRPVAAGRARWWRWSGSKRRLDDGGGGSESSVWAGDCACGWGSAGGDCRHGGPERRRAPIRGARSHQRRYRSLRRRRPRAKAEVPRDGSSARRGSGAAPFRARSARRNGLRGRASYRRTTPSGAPAPLPARRTAGCGKTAHHGPGRRPTRSRVSEAHVFSPVAGAPCKMGR